MQTHARKKSGWGTRLILALILVSVIGGQFFVAPKQSLAASDSMQDYFAVDQSKSAGVDSIIPVGTIPYGGDGDDDYIVDTNSFNISIPAGNQPTSNTVTFDIFINFENAPSAIVQGVAERDNPPDQYINSDDDIGSWQAFYNPNDIVGSANYGQLPLIDDSGAIDDNGFHLEIGTGVIPATRQDPANPNATISNSPPIAPVITGLVLNEALGPVINFTKTRQTIRVVIGTDASLTSDTQYYARVRADEEASGDTAYTKIIAFKTNIAGDTDQATGTISGSLVDAQTTNEGDLTSSLKCVFNDISDGTFADCFVILFWYLFYVPSSWILAASGWLFDAFLSFSISSKIYSDPEFITEGWKIVRDLCNIFFIFLLIMIAVKIILDLDSGGAKKMLVQLILIAIIINFSLFFTRVVVDSSNILARVFYKQIQVTGSGSKPVLDATQTGIEQRSLSEALVDGFSVTTIISDETLQKMNATGWHSTSTVFLLAIIGTVINIVAAWTLFICALLFVGRIVGLWVVMVFAAFAFLTYASPGLNKIPQISWGAWISNLFNLSFLAPIFLFFIYLIIRFIQTGFLDGFLLKSENYDFTQVLIAMMLQFAVLIVMIKQARKMAEKLAGELGGSVVSGLKGVTSTVSGAVMGAVGFAAGGVVAAATGGLGAAGRAVIGRSAAKTSQSQSLRAREAKGGVGGWIARQQLRAADYLKKSSFDVRATSGFQSAMSGLGGAMDAKIKSGKAQEGGYEGAKKREEEKREKRAKAILVSSDQAALEAPENKDVLQRYQKAKGDYDTNKKAYDTYTASFEREKETKKANNPTFDEAAFKAQYEREWMQKTGKSAVPVEPKEPKKEEYGIRSKESINQERTKNYADSLRERGVSFGATRAGELATATKLEDALAKQEASIAKINEESKKNLDALNDLGGKVAASLDKSKKSLTKFTDQLREIETLINNRSPQEMRDAASAVRASLATDNLDISDLDRQYAAEQDKQKKDQIKKSLTQKILARNKKQDELADLESAFKDKDRIEKDIAKTETDIADKNDSLMKIAERKTQAEERKKEKMAKTKE